MKSAERALVPEHYERRQSLVNAERYTTTQLREYESQILHSKERAEEMETAIFRQVCAQVASAAPQVLATAKAAAEIDVALALAEAAARYGYVRPSRNAGDAIVIRDGRHPMVERSLAAGAFVPNDTELASGDAQIVILTGPNMAGKSTYLRWVAIIADGAGGRLPSGGVGVDRRGRPRVHAVARAMTRRPSGRPSWWR
jgi:DNA mismatch repair protein MutS